MVENMAQACPGVPYMPTSISYFSAPSSWQCLCRKVKQLVHFNAVSHLFSSYSIGSVQTEMAQKTIVLGE